MAVPIDDFQIIETRKFSALAVNRYLTNKNAAVPTLAQVVPDYRLLTAWLLAPSVQYTPLKKQIWDMAMQRKTGFLEPATWPALSAILTEAELIFAELTLQL